MARESNERPRLVARIPAIAMFGSSNIPAWFLADTSPNEYAILQSLRSSEEQQQQDRAAAAAKKEEDVGESSTVPATARSAYPLAVAASGRGVRRRRLHYLIGNRSLVTNVVVGLVALLGLALLLLFRAHPETAAGWMRSTATSPAPAPAPRRRWLTSIQPWNNKQNGPQDHTTPWWSRWDAGARKTDDDWMKVKPVPQQAVRVVKTTTTAAAPKTKEVAPVAVPRLLPSPTRSVVWNWTLEVEEKEQEAAVPAEPRVLLSPLPEQTDLFVDRVQQLAQQMLKHGSKMKKPAFLGRVKELAQQLLKNGSTLEVEEKEQEAAVPVEPRVLLSPLPEQTDLFVDRVQQLVQQMLKHGSKMKKPAFLGRVKELAQQLLKNGSTLEVEEKEQEAAVPAEPRVLLSPLPEQTDLFVDRVQQLAQQMLKHGSQKKKPAFFGRVQQLAQQLLKNGSKAKTLLPSPTRSVAWNWTLEVQEKEQEAAVPAEPRVLISPLPEQTDLFVDRVQQLAQQWLKHGSKTEKNPAFFGRAKELAQQLLKNGSKTKSLLPSPTRSVAWNWTLEVQEKEQEAAVPAEPRVLLSPLPEQTDLFVGRVQQLAQLLKHGSKEKNPAFFGRVKQLAQRLLKNGSKTKTPAAATTVPPIIRTALALF